jgi:hypothetical protein
MPTANPFDGNSSSNPFAGGSAQPDAQSQNVSNSNTGQGGDDLTPNNTAAPASTTDNGNTDNGTTAKRYALYAVGCLACGQDGYLGRIAADTMCRCGSSNLVYDTTPLIVTAEFPPKKKDGDDDKKDSDSDSKGDDKSSGTGPPQQGAPPAAPPVGTPMQQQNQMAQGLPAAPGTPPPAGQAPPAPRTPAQQAQQAPGAPPATPPAQGQPAPPQAPAAPPTTGEENPADGGAPTSGGNVSDLPNQPANQTIPGTGMAVTPTTGQPLPAGPDGNPAPTAPTPMNPGQPAPGGAPAAPGATPATATPAMAGGTAMDRAQQTLDAVVQQVNQLGHDAMESAYDVDQLFSEWRCNNCGEEGRADISEDGQVAFSGLLTSPMGCAAPGGAVTPQMNPAQDPQKPAAEEQGSEAPSDDKSTSDTSSKKQSVWRRAARRIRRQATGTPATIGEDSFDAQSEQDDQGGESDDEQSQEKVAALIEDILSSNPGASPEFARKVAEATLARFPSVKAIERRK